MAASVLAILERMAETGTAPDEGVSMFSVGHDDALRRIADVYLTRRFSRGVCSEKYVVGPFGSGKTHFLRQLQETARGMECCTAEIALTKDVDFTDGLAVYSEIAREIRPPGSHGRGVRVLLEAIANRIRSQAPAEPLADKLLAGWTNGLSHQDLKLEAFGRVARKAMEAYMTGNETRFENACRWLSGEVTDKQVALDLNVTQVNRAGQNAHARQALLSLFQLIRHAGFAGTVVCMDEAEQGLSVEKKKLDRILSQLQSAINAMADLQRGSALVVYAITPDLRDEMMRFPALQQRVADPGPGQGFQDGNTRASLIPLIRASDPVADLQAIGQRLVDLLYSVDGSHHAVPPETVSERVAAIARSVATDDPTSSNRRTMVKRTCALLVHLYDTGEVQDVLPVVEADDDEV